VLVGKVNVPLLLIVLIMGAVSVLLVSVSVVALPTRVSVLVGKVKVPLLLIVLIMGAVSVLLVSVCTEATFTKVQPPAVLPSCTRIVLSCVSTVSSPIAPVKAIFCAVVPLLSCI
jgi:hypothetical protein